MPSISPMPRISLHARVLGFQSFSSAVKILAGLANVPEQSVEHAQKFDGHGASQRSSAKGRAVHSRMHSAGTRFVVSMRSERKAGCQAVWRR